MQQVISVVAGFAGLDTPDDAVWAEQNLNVPGLDCKTSFVNDAVVAHAGSFLTEPGIVAISGTGSIIFAINERGRQLRNYDFRHYAYTAARHLSYHAVHQIIAHGMDSANQNFIDSVLDFCNVGDIAELAELAAAGFIANKADCDRRFGLMGPLVTEAAATGAPLARKVCDKAAQELAEGVRLLGSGFCSQVVAVTCLGSVIRHPGLKNALISELGRQPTRYTRSSNRPYPQQQEPHYSR